MRLTSFPPRAMALAGTVAIAIAFGLVGCSTIALQSEEGSGSGVVYNLPKTALDLTVTQKYLPKGWQEIKSGHFFRWADQASPQTEQEKADGIYRPSKSAPKYISRLQRLNAGKDAQYLAWFEKEKVLEYALSPTSRTIADVTQRYVLKHKPSPLFHERLCIGRNPKTSLLTNVEYAAEDRTPQILYNVARAATAIFTQRAAALDREPLAESDDPRTNPATRTVARTIDPWNVEYDHHGNLYNAELNSFNGEMVRVFGERIYLDLNDALTMMAKPVDDSIAKQCGNDTQCRKKRRNDLASTRCDEDKICYRSRMEVPLRLRNGDDEDRTVAIKRTDVVNQFDLGSVDVTRGFLIQKVTKVLFADGVLVGVAVKKPSEVEAATLLPVNAITAALTTPVGLLSNLFSGNLQTQLSIAQQLGQQQNAMKEFRDSQAATATVATLDDKLYQIRCSDDSSKTSFSLGN